MNCTISAADGSIFALPQVFSWDICHSFGSPCDSFEVKLPLTNETGKVLEKGVYFGAQSAGKTVFCGIIDEFELCVSAQEPAAYLRGRGMQARLLDNEAESAQHYLMSLDTLLDSYVRAFGISRIERGTAGSARGNLTVDSGASCWSVVSEFCRFHAGTLPRFAPDGTLHVDGEKGGRSIVVNERTPILEMSYCEDRYGVISSVIVKNRARGTKVQMENEKYLGKGLSCRRVINVPRATGYDAMRHTGAYQMEHSASEMITAKIALPWAFAAFPGDIVTIEASPVGVTGRFMVRDSRCRGSAQSVQTSLVLIKTREDA